MSQCRPAAVRVATPDGTVIAAWRGGQGPPIVAVHGVMVDHSAWDGVQGALERVGTLVRFDRRGHGASDHGPSAYSLAQEITDLAAVIGTCPAPVKVVAHSYGGLIALEAARQGLPIDRLIVYEPSVGSDPHFPGVLERVRSRVEEGRIAEAAETLLVDRLGVPREAMHTVRQMPLWSMVMHEAQLLPREGAVMVSYPFDPRRFADLRVPTLVLCGGNSPSWRRDAMGTLHAALPDSQLRDLPGQGHLATHTAPELLAGEILDFLGL